MMLLLGNRGQGLKALVLMLRRGKRSQVRLISGVVLVKEGLFGQEVLLLLLLLLLMGGERITPGGGSSHDLGIEQGEIVGGIAPFTRQIWVRGFWPKSRRRFRPFLFARLKIKREEEGK